MAINCTWYEATSVSFHGIANDTREDRVGRLYNHFKAQAMLTGTKSKVVNVV